MNDEPHNLIRFEQAQAGGYQTALAEIRGGRKQSHWMWYIFPQAQGLGRSETARRYSIKDMAEARAYLSHPVLGRRLLECAEAVLRVKDRSATQIFGSPDDMKLRSSATLFAAISPRGSVFDQLLKRYFPEGRDELTLRLMGLAPSRGEDPLTG